MNATKFYESFFPLKSNFKRREKIFQHNNQEELLLISSGGFERKVALPKTLVKDYGILQLFKSMAYVTNELYCNREHEYIIGRGFIGPEMIRNQMEKTKYKLGILHPNLDKFKVDSHWWKSWPEDCFQSFDGRIRAAVNILKNGTEANNPIHIVLTGHGIGGFYAQVYGLLMSSELRFHENLDITIITFGSPRSGDSQFAGQFQRMVNLKAYRITHTNDYFPHFPKKSIDGKSYMHPGTEYWIQDRNCNCDDPDSSRLLREGYEIIYECQGFYLNDKKKYVENPGCNLDTDGKGTRAHFGPYFGVTFGNCENYYPIVKFNQVGNSYDEQD
ncbi:hypothetical protein G9A89_018272 [Geosiphon pyriformis]|nr:hypothetical protein G9A89_018272 [Geosiphon pyriformis]